MHVGVWVMPTFLVDMSGAACDIPEDGLIGLKHVAVNDDTL